MAPTMLVTKRLIPETEKLIEIGTRLALTVLVAFVFQRLLYLGITRFERFVVRLGDSTEASRQRAETLGQLLRSFVNVLVWGGAFIHGLDVLGWDVKPLLAGAGVLGLAVGFGAQTLVRDTIAGVFILAEDQFSVGDLIEVNGRPATVEALTLRMTRLRDFNGYIHFVPNGEMKIVTNRSRGWQRLAVDVPVASDQDLDLALAICRREAESLSGDPAWRGRLLEPAETWGLESLGPTEATIRIVLRGRPGPDAPEAARALRQRIHRALMDKGLRTSVSRDIAIRPVTPSGPEGPPSNT